MHTDAVVVKATRLPQKKQSAASTGLVLVEFSSLADKQKIFRARAKLVGSSISFDDDLTPLQQRQKAAAWPAFKEAKAKATSSLGSREAHDQERSGMGCPPCVRLLGRMGPVRPPLHCSLEHERRYAEDA